MGYMLLNERMLETFLHAKKFLKPKGENQLINLSNNPYKYKMNIHKYFLKIWIIHFINNFSITSSFEKGTVSVISCKEVTARFTTYPWNLSVFVKKYRDMCVNVSKSTCINSCKFQTERNEHRNFQLIMQKDFIHFHTAMKGTVMNRAVTSSYEGSLKITLTVPLRVL